MKEEREDVEESAREDITEEEDVYVLEEDGESTYESIIEATEQEGSEATGLAPADPSDEYAKLLAENQELRDRYLRILADHENFKRRTDKERIETWGFAVSEVIREILPVLDNFERAIESGRTHDPDSELLSGIEMICDQLLDVLRRQGVTVIDQTGVAFDPQIHEGVHREENPDVPAHTVIRVMQKGYSLRGRLLRPAMVTVAVGGEENGSDQGDAGAREER